VGGKRFLIIAALFMLTAGCATSAPRWRDEALALLTEAHREGADTLLPEQFRSTEEVWTRGELLLREGERDEAERQFSLALDKGRTLRDDAALERQRLLKREADRIEAQRQELEKKRLQEEETRLNAEIAAARKTKEEEAGTEKRKWDKPIPQQERPLPTAHTVKRGETLPLIAAQSDVYSDANLWPLLYRANRDQISDPRHIWPGQVLRIPRNATRDEIAEARRYARTKPLY
jgi:nucleoid-associated protein YgaU